MSTENSVRLLLPRQNEKSVSKVEKEVDEGPLKKGESFGSNSSRRAMALGGAAGLLTAYPVAAEVNLNPKNAIVIEGEMPSQNLEDNMGVVIEEDQYITLKPGDKGSDVERLKQGFFDYGYYKNESSVNETFTTNTVEYVKKFQEINGLPVDGIASPEFQAFFFSDKALRVDGTPVAVEVTPKPEETQIGPETDDAQVITTESTNVNKEILPGSEEEKIIDARFKSLFEGIGEFSDKKLKDKMYYSYIEGEVDLGLCGLRDNGRDYVVQGVLLGHFWFGDKNFVAMGVKNKEGQKEIYLVQWLVKERIAAYPFGAMAEEMVEKGTSYKYTIKPLYTEDEAISFLENKLGSVVLFHFYNGDYKVESSIDKKIHDYYAKYVVPRRDTNINFVSGLLVNSKSSRFRLEGVGLVDTLDKNEEYKVVNYSDVMSKLKNTSNNEFPLLDYIGYRK